MKKKKKKKKEEEATQLNWAQLTNDKLIHANILRLFLAIICNFDSVRIRCAGFASETTKKGEICIWKRTKRFRRERERSQKQLIFFFLFFLFD